MPLQFTVELSDAQGSFTTPLVIGSVVATNAEGTIPCTIPANFAPGAGYMVRVRTSSPFHAPVPVPLPLAAVTSTPELQAAPVPVFHDDGRLIVDLRVVDWHGVELDILDVAGRCVHHQQLVPGSLNTIPDRGFPRVHLVRVRHRMGVWSVRAVRW
jgi:hypothetical protein